MLIPHDSNIGIEYTDFSLGFSVIPEHSRRLADYYIFNRAAEEAEKDTDNQIEELTRAWDIEDRLARKKTFDTRFNDKISEAVIAISDIIKTTEVISITTPNGAKTVERSLNSFLLNYIEHLVTRVKIIWNDEFDAYEKNIDLAQEISEELMNYIVRQINISSKLYALRNEFTEFWGDSTKVRFDWTVGRFAPEYVAIRTSEEEDSTIDAKCSAYTLATAKEFVKALNLKLKRKQCSSEEYRSIFRLFGLLSVGYDKDFPITDLGLDKNNKEIWRSLLSAVSKYVWWSISNRRREENISTDGKEPLDLVQEDTLRGPHYTLDYDDMCRMIQDGSGEDSFKECFNTFSFTNNEGKEEHRYYKTTDSREYKNSFEQSIKLLESLQKLYLNNVNIHKYRIQNSSHPCFGLGFLQTIEYYQGKRFHIKKVIVDGEKVDCKKMSPRVLIDYHAKSVREMFWSVYKLQQEAGIIPVTDNVKSAEIAEEMPV